MVADHGTARAGGHDDVFGILEHIEKMQGYIAGRLAIAAVERRLATTGLGLAKFDLASGALQHVGHGDSNLGKYLIYDASDEQRNPVGHQVRIVTE